MNYLSSEETIMLDLIDGSATFDNMRYETLEQMSIMTSYLEDHQGNPHVKGLLAFCVKQGLPFCALKLLKAGADPNDTLDNKSALNYLHMLPEKEFHPKTRKNLKKLELALLQKDAKDFVQTVQTINPQIQQNSR